MANDPITGRPMPFAPHYTVRELGLDGKEHEVDIAATLVDYDSRARAVAIYRHQEATSIPMNHWLGLGKIVLNASAQNRREEVLKVWESLAKHTPPMQYTIPYYLPTEKGQAIAPKLIEFFSSLIDVKKDKKVAESEEKKRTYYINSHNPIGQPNANMERAAHDAFAMIESQLPGRFKFVRTPVADNALLNFASVPKLIVLEDIGKGIAITGSTDQMSGSILVSSEFYTGGYSSNMASSILHEIGHGLGLQHPHNLQKDKGSASSEKATYFDTVMTYDVNNFAQPSAAYNRPVSLMPGDLQALQRLYPIQRDFQRDTVKVGPVNVLQNPSEFRAILEQGQGKTVLPFSTMGLTLYDIVDTNNDILRIEQPALTPQQPQSRKNDMGAQGNFYATIQQLPNGIAVTKPYKEASVYALGHIEKIILSSAAEEVTITGNVEVYSPRNSKEQFPGTSNDMFYVSGKNNRISLSTYEIDTKTSGLTLKPGAQLALTLRDTDQLKPSFDFSWLMIPDYRDAAREPKVQVRWTEENGVFLVRMSDANDSKSPPIDLTIQLENATAKDIAAFRTIIAKPIMAGYLADKEIFAADGSKKIEKEVAYTKPITPIRVKQSTEGFEGHGLPDKSILTPDLKVR